MAVTAEKISWTEEAGRFLATARATPADLAQWQEDVQAGTAQLWQFSGDFKSYVLTRVEEYHGGQLEMVIVAGAGKNSREVIAWVTKLAKDHGIPTIRAHINRPGLCRIFQKQGYHLDEWVMRTKTDGQ